MSSLQELCCLARGEFVLKKDMLSFPGNIYSRENKPDAEEVWRGLHNGGETSSFLPSSASCTLGIPTSLGAWDHNGKASQFFLNSFEKLLPFLSSIASSGNFTQDLNHSSVYLYHPYVGPPKTASQLTHPWSKVGGPAQHEIVSSRFLFSPVHETPTEASQPSSPSQMSMLDSTGCFARSPMSCHGHSQSIGERGQAWWLPSIAETDGVNSVITFQCQRDDCSTILKPSHTYMHSFCSFLKFCIFPLNLKTL